MKQRLPTPMPNWIIFFCALGLSIGSVLAQGPGFYLKLDGGINYIPNTDLTASGRNGDMSLESGYRVVAAGGYEVNRWLALELEGGFFENSINTVKLQGLTAHVHQSSLSGVPIVANVVLRYENSSDFMPYVSVGAGGLRSTLRISGEKDHDLVLALQAQAGIIYKIDEQAWIEAGYRLLGTPREHYDLAGTSIQTDTVFSHFFGVGAIWKF